LASAEIAARTVLILCKEIVMAQMGRSGRR
jgi:hypothetical protein